jgi:hypothetical protein
MVKLNGFWLGSFVAKLTVPLKMPAATASSRTLKVVDAPGASVVVPKSDARLNPDGRVIVPSVRFDVPALRTVKLRVTAVPMSVWPRSIDPVPSVTKVEPSNTWALGPDTLPPIHSMRTASAIR